MLPEIITYILSLTDVDGAPVAEESMTQVIIDPFPALLTFNFSMSPASNIEAQLLYEISFGEAMVPHAFDVKIHQAGVKVLDAIISGRFTGRSIGCFVFLTTAHPLQVQPTNLRALDQYYEMSAFYLNVPNLAALNIIRDAIKTYSQPAAAGIQEEQVLPSQTLPYGWGRGLSR